MRSSYRITRALEPQSLPGPAHGLSGGAVPCALAESARDGPARLPHEPELGHARAWPRPLPPPWHGSWDAENDQRAAGTPVPAAHTPASSLPGRAPMV